MKDLILQSLKAHKIYALSCIQSPKNQLYYQEMFENVERYVQSFENYYMPIFVLEHSFSQMRDQKFFINSELRYKKLALEHASNVILAINKRFTCSK